MVDQVIVKLKVYPEDPSKSKEVEGKLKEIEEVKEVKEEELGFGIKILKTTALVNEADGTDGIEATIGKIEGVSQVEIESVDRAL